MLKGSYYIVNGITLYRLLAAPLLVFLIINHRLDLFKWLLAVSFFTDAVDGYLARRYQVTSIAGTKLDSLGDDLTILVGMIGIAVINPEFILQEIYVFLFLLFLFLLQATLAIVRYGKMTNFHTYLAKIAAVLQGVFLLLFFFLDQPVYPLFLVAAGVTAFELAEEIILVFILPEWEINVKGLFWVIKRKKIKQP